MATIKGLRKLRAKTGKAPTHECSNCKCKRYSPCTCMKAGVYTQPDKAQD